MGVIKNLISIGYKFETKHWGEISVTDINGYDKITVMFADGNTKTVAAKEVRSGSVKNEAQPDIYGVGFIGYGNHTSRFKDGKNTPEYDAWRGILRRCYDTVFHKKRPTYIGCEVCTEWHNFQNFAEWYVVQRGYEERWHLDKDLTVFDNKVYSPETCALIPCEVNSIFTGASKLKRGTYPKGVHWCNTKKVFVSQIHVGGVAQKFLGYHTTHEAAFKAYKVAKESHVKEVANKFIHEITPTIYNNLMNYTVSITD